MKKDSLINFIEEVFTEEFKYAYVDGWFQANSQTKCGNLNNLAFLDTRYYAQSANKKYLHFTNSDSAASILRSGCLWMSNLNTFKYNDEQELTLGASKILGISDEFIAFKNRMFAVCFTEVAESQDIYEDFPYHWKEYSKSSSGISFEFEFGPKNKQEGLFEDSVLNPFYYLTKIQYQDEEYEDRILKRLKDQIERVADSNFNKLSLMEFLAPLICAHKRKQSENKLFFCEKETRLLYISLYDPIDCNYYTPGNKKEDTFGGIDDNYNPFRQLPFDTDKSFLILKAIHPGKRISLENKSKISELARVYDLGV